MTEKKEKETNHKKEERRTMFYNFWGWKVSRIAFIFILLVFLLMVSMQMCDSKYIVKQGPETIKIIP